MTLLDQSWCQDKLLKILVLTILLSYSQGAISDGLRISPLKLYFDETASNTSIKLSNDSDQKITVQLEALAWSQDVDGQDHYEPTPDIIFFPKVLSIEPHEERKIRVGYHGQIAVSLERTYRLYVQELPVASPGVVEMKFAVRMGVPIFVRSAQELASWKIDSIQAVQEGLQIRINNSGNRFLMVGTLRALGRDEVGTELFDTQDQGWYVLAGKGRNFIIPLNKDACNRAATIDMVVNVGEETRNQVIDVNSINCSILNESQTQKRRMVPGH